MPNRAKISRLFSKKGLATGLYMKDFEAPWLLAKGNKRKQLNAVPTRSSQLYVLQEKLPKHRFSFLKSNYTTQIAALNMQKPAEKLQVWIRIWIGTQAFLELGILE